MAPTPRPSEILYQISARPYLFELSKRLGRKVAGIREIPDSDLDALKDEGITWVWLMGVWELGKIGLEFDRTFPPLLQGYKGHLPDFVLEDVIGSPYAVAEYRCNPELGTDEDLAAFRGRLHARGMKLMLDFVPNHTARDARLRKEKPQCYMREPKHRGRDTNRYDGEGYAYGRDMYCDPWRDTLQLNYWNVETREEMIGALRRIAGLCDGVRCDMAMLVLNWVIAKTWAENVESHGHKQPPREFWSEAIGAVRGEHPAFCFMAECYWDTEETLMSLGFDYVYDKDIYDRLERGHMDNLRGYLGWRKQPYLARCAHFVENHDEPRAVAAFHGVARANAAALATMTLPGLRFFFHGQWDGRANKLDVHLRRALDEAGRPEARDFYRRLLPVIREPVFGPDAAFAPCAVSGSGAWRLLAWRWSLGPQRRLVVINYTDGMDDGRVQVLDAAGRDGRDELELRDLLSGEAYKRSAREMREAGLHVVLGPWAGHVFAY
eukprot:tig00000025_g7950.t1